MFDLAVRNGLVADGGRERPFVGAVYLKDGKIAEVSTDHTLPAAVSIDAAGSVVSPGFVDMHSHSDCAFLTNPTHEGKLVGGVTFELVGQCGSSIVPVSEKNREAILLRSGYELDAFPDENGMTLTNFDEYARAVERRGVSVNMSTLIGHGILRSYVAGWEMRKLREEEIRTMCDVLEDQFRQGAPGLSLGLIYPPGCFGDTEELIALAGVAARYGRMLAVHMRNENKGIFDALDEVVFVAKKTGVRLQVSHLKLMGTGQWGQAEKLLRRLEAARAEGVRVHCDQYPYTASSSGLTSCLPQWTVDGGYSALVERLKTPEVWKKILTGGLPEMYERGGPSRIVIGDTMGYSSFPGVYCEIKSQAAGINGSL